MPDIVIAENITGTAMTELRRRFDVAFEPESGITNLGVQAHGEGPGGKCP